MSTFQYACPHCTQKNVISAGNVGHVVSCVHCRKPVAWDGETPIPGPDAPPPPPKRIRWKNVSAGALGLVIALPLLLQGCWNMLQAFRSTSWPSTDGVVISSGTKHSETRAGRRSSGTAVAANIQYSYQVDGVTYHNDTVRLGNVYASDLFGIASATVKRHPAGPETIYYDAQNPGISVLEPGIHASLCLPTGAGLLFTILSGAFLLRELRRFRKPGTAC